MNCFPVAKSRLYELLGTTVKSPHTHNDNGIRSSESKVNFCMCGVIVLPNVVNFYFDRIWSTLKSKLTIIACMGALRGKMRFCTVLRIYGLCSHGEINVTWVAQNYSYEGMHDFGPYYEYCTVYGLFSHSEIKVTWVSRNHSWKGKCDFVSYYGYMVFPGSKLC